MATASGTVRPGGTLGIIGGGPMARQVALAAHAFGYRPRVLAPEDDTACTGIAEVLFHGSAMEPRLAAAFAAECDVVTAIAEQTPPDALHAAAALAPVRPGPTLVALAQDRARERAWLERRGLQLGPWGVAADAAQFRRLVEHLGFPCFVKPRRRLDRATRPAQVSSADEAEAAWHGLGERPCVVEAALPIDLELCVLVARAPGGIAVAYPPAVGCRSRTELIWSAMPGDVPPRMAQKAQSLAAYVASRLELEGLLAVEMFVLHDGRLVVNELVPCPHQLYHAADVACGTSQAEQLVRAVCGLPLGAVAVTQPAAMSPLTDDWWDGATAAQLADALRVPGVRLHLFDASQQGPADPRGHLIAAAASSGDAVERVLRARRHVARRSA